jgi:hypothetical protein
MIARTSQPGFSPSTFKRADDALKAQTLTWKVLPLIAYVTSYNCIAPPAVDVVEIPVLTESLKIAINCTIMIVAVAFGLHSG